MDAMQSLINSQNDLLLGAHDLINEVTRLRLELEEEKTKNRKLEQQIKVLNDKVMQNNFDYQLSQSFHNNGSADKENSFRTTKATIPSITTMTIETQKPSDDKICNPIDDQLSEYRVKQKNRYSKAQNAPSVQLHQDCFNNCNISPHGQPDQATTSLPKNNLDDSFSMQIVQYRNKHNNRFLNIQIKPWIYSQKSLNNPGQGSVTSNRQVTYMPKCNLLDSISNKKKAPSTQWKRRKPKYRKRRGISPKPSRQNQSYLPYQNQYIELGKLISHSDSRREK